jgi:ribonuclease BN (tRNA processing enzyme)
VRAAAAALGHPLADEDWPFPLRFQELRPGAPAAIGPAEVRAAGARHHPDARPLVLDVAAGGRRIVYTGDTGWFDGLPDLARGADLFVLLTHLGEEMARRRGACAFETADDGLVIAL